MRNAVTRSGHGADRQLPRDTTHPDQKVRLAQELNQMSVSGPNTPPANLNVSLKNNMISGNLLFVPHP